MKEIIKAMLLEGIDEETIREAMSVIEGFHLSNLVGDARSKGKIDHGKWNKLHDKALKVPGTNDYFYDEKGNIEATGTPIKDLSKAEKGQIDNQIRTAAKTGRSLYQMGRRQKQDAENGYEVARNKSINRHARKHKVSESLYEEIMEAVVEILSEKVTMAQWKQAAKNSIGGRENAEIDAENYLNNVLDHKSLHGQAHKAHNIALKALDRTKRARKLANELPDSNFDAGKVFNAAKKVVDSRSKTTNDRINDTKNAVEAKDWNAAHDLSIEKNKAFDREDQARILANKPLRDYDEKDKELKVGNGNYFNHIGAAHKSK